MELTRINTNKTLRYNLVAVLYPICLIFDAFFLPSTELGNLVFSEELDTLRITSPFTQIILALLVLPLIKKGFRSSTFYFYFIFIVAINVLLFTTSFLLKINLIAGLITIYFLMTSPSVLITFKYFIFSYTILSILIIFYRFYVLGVSLVHLRADINIWGGLDLISMVLGYYVMSSIKSVENKNYILICAFVLSIIYVSRSGLIITGLMILLNISKIKISNIIFMFGFFLILYFPLSEYLDWILARFDMIDSDTLYGSRGFIWDESLDLLRQNPNGIGLGNYILNSPKQFSNPHNFFIDIFINFGYISGFILSIFITKNLLRFILMGDFKLFLNYFLFLSLLTIGGLTFIQVGGSVSFHTMLCFCVIDHEMRK